MVKLSFATGTILIVVGLLGFFFSGMASWTALIPAIVGALFLVGAFIGKKPEKRKLGMHISAGVALLGFLGASHPLVKVLQGGEFGAAQVSAALMGVLCLVFLIFAIKSFIDARKNTQKTTP